MRKLVQMVGATLVSALALGSGAFAEDYPERPIRLIVAYSAGGSTDFAARLLADEMSKHLSQPVAVENKPGASGAVGSEFVARSDPDGYRLILGTGTYAIDKTLRPNLPYNVDDSFEPITMVVRSPFVLTVRDDFPAQTLEEFVAYVKAHPGEVNYGSPGVNTQTHLATELFGSVAGLDWVQIPFQGESKALTAMLGGEVQTVLLSLSTARPQIEAGTIRGFVQTGPNRSPMYPDIRTVAEAGIGEAEATFWFGVFAPKGTPQPVLDKLYEAVAESLKSEEVVAKFADRGFEVNPMRPTEFRKLIDSDVAKWKAVVDRAGLKPQD
ncbi:MAG: tripartite tricarboxylate transporter substrate binding protein [Paracoccaceae bacterium]